MFDREHAGGSAELCRRRFLSGAAATAGSMFAGLAGAGPVRAHELAQPEPSPFAAEPGRFAAQALKYLYGPVQRVNVVAPAAIIRVAGTAAPGAPDPGAPDPGSPDPDIPYAVRMAGGFTVAVGEGFANSAKRLLSVALNPVEVAVDGADRELGMIRLRLDRTRPAPPSALQSIDPSGFFRRFGEASSRDPRDPHGTYERLFAMFFPASATAVFNAVVTLGSMPGTELVNRDPIALGNPTVPWFPPAGEGYAILNAPVELIRRNDPSGRTVAVVDSFPAAVDFSPDAGLLVPAPPPAPHD